jgi:hypothetical protein
MITNKECGPERKQMNCEMGICSYKETVQPIYSWFQDVISKCKASDFSCRLHDSVIIWSHRNIHECPFKRIIKQTNFKIEEDGFTSSELNLNFVFNKEVSQCGFTLMKMMEGVYIKLSNLHDDQFFKKTGNLSDQETIDLKKITELTLASLDFVTKTQQQDIKEAFELNCKIFQNNIRMLASRSTHEYFYITDMNGNEILLYAHNGFVYNPECYYFPYMRVRKTLPSCSSYIEVELLRNISGTSWTGVINSQGIVVQKRENHIKLGSDTCRTLRQLIKLNGDIALIREHYQTRIIMLNEISQETIDFAILQAGIQINHSSVIDQDFNIDKIIERNVMTNDYAPVTYDKTIIKNDLHNLSRTFSYTIFLIYLIVIIIIIVILIYFYYKYKFYKFCVFCIFKKEKIVENDKLKNNQAIAEEKILLELNNLHKFTDDDIVV